MMKVTLVFAALLAAASAVPLNEGVCGYHEYGVKVHPECTQFYVCNYGTPVVQSCAGGLYFNGNIMGCDYKANIKDCAADGRRLSYLPSPEDEPAAPGPVVPAQPEEPAPVVPEVPEPAPVVPEAPVVPTPEEPAAGEPSGDCPQKPYYYLTNPSNSKTFIVCLNGKVSGTSNCGAELVFSQTQQACL